MANPRSRDDELERLANLEEEVRRLKVHGWGEGSGTATPADLSWSFVPSGWLGPGVSHYPGSDDDLHFRYAFDRNALYLRGWLLFNHTTADITGAGSPGWSLNNIVSFPIGAITGFSFTDFINRNTFLNFWKVLVPVMGGGGVDGKTTFANLTPELATGGTTTPVAWRAVVFNLNGFDATTDDFVMMFDGVVIPW